MSLDGAKFICLSDAAAADATETTPKATTGVEAGGISDVSTSENIIIKAKGRKFTVGYYMNCDYVLEDPRAIGVHCEIQCDAFGRVTIHNNSEAYPISVNEQIITLKRPLLDGSRIKILGRNFLWKFSKSLEATGTSKSKDGNDATNDDTVSTPQKLVAVPEQAPNSCPDLKHHRKMDKRFTVHNFAYCINSDEEGNISSELKSINESESVEETGISEFVTQKESNKNGSLKEMSVEDKEILPSSTASHDSADGKATLENSNVERRSITPEPHKNEPTITNTPLIKLEETPKMNLINCTQNKENRSTEKKIRLLSFCKQSDVVITSFSPRETGVRTEKSFTAVVKPSLYFNTPKSVYSTPKSMLSDYNDGSIDFIDFTTPSTSKKGARVLSRNSSMHLIDLTTPSKLAPDSPHHRLAHKGNKTLPSHVKLSTTPISGYKLKEDSAHKEDARLLPRAQTMGTTLNKSESSPQSAESIISVDETSDSSAGVIEISAEDSPVPSTSSPVRAGFTTKTPQRPIGQKPFTSTPLRTPQSLLKRAIVTSAKKQINSSLRSALGKATPTRQPTSTTALSRKLNATSTAETTGSTPKSRISIGSPSIVDVAQRRNISSLPRRTSLVISQNRELAITPSTTTVTRLPQSRKIPASASRLNTTKRASPLHGVRKSFGGTTLTSHISKTRRSVISPRKHSPTSVAAKLAAKARKSFIPYSSNNRQVASRAHSLVSAAVSTKNSKLNPTTTDIIPQKKENFGIVEKTTGEIKNEVPLEEQNEIDDLSRTFRVDDSMEENPSTASVPAASTSQKRELNKTFSPDKSVTGSESKVALDVTVDIAKTSIEAQKQHKLANLNDKDNSNSIITEHISESFAEVVETNNKTDEKMKNPETLKDIIGEIPKISAPFSVPEKQADDVITTADESTIEDDNLQDSKLIEEQVIETLDAGEISGYVAVEKEQGTPKGTLELTPPSSSEKIDTEDMSKGSGESQGTAELLEEIEYVLNKSDELQQQLNKEAHTSNIEVIEELEAAIEDNLGGKTEDVSTKNNIKIDVNINFEDSDPTVKDDPATPSTSPSVVPTSSDIQETQEDTSFTGDVEDIVHKTVEDLEIKNEIVASAEEDSVNKSKVDVIPSINSADVPKDSSTTLELGEETEHIQAAVITRTEQIVDTDIQKTIDNNRETEITDSQTESIKTEVKKAESVLTKLDEYKSVTSESRDVGKTADETKTQTSNSSKTITAESEPDSIVEEKPKLEVEDQSAANSERNSNNEKEDKILFVKIGKPTSNADETENMSASEPKTPNLCGIREMLRTPKQREATTPRFVGLRNLMRTPKASTSAAAAAACVEADTEELIGLQKLLKTPHLSRAKAETPQKAADDNKSTPRRSTRRRASANPELTPTPKTVTETDDTPRRTTRRRASASAEVNYTPQRITRRRSSLALDNDGGPDKQTLTPITRGNLRAKRPGTIVEVPVAEDMGAIIEEELKECVQESAEDQKDLVETEKKKEVIKTEGGVHDIHEVIEESICEEVNAQKQEVVEQKEESMEDKTNKEYEKTEMTTNEIAPTCVTEKLDKNVDKAENATESEFQQTHITQVEEVVVDSPCNVSEEECLTETKDLPSDKTAQVLDESDYEYGKEVIDQTVATVSTDTQPKTPKTQRKSDRIADPNIAESPKTPVMVGMRELLKTPKDCGDTPKLVGMRDLLRTPKPILASVTTDVADDADRLIGLDDLMKTPKVAKTHCEKIEDEKKEENDELSTSKKAHAEFIGMRELLKTPKYTSTPYYSGMREMLRTPKACSTPQLAGVGELMETPKRTKLDVEYDDKNEELDQFFKTPRAKNIMIPADPASAILEPSSDSSAEIMMAATTEYDLHSSSQRPLEELYKTPMRTHLTNVEIEQSEKKTGNIEVIKDKSLSATPNQVEVSVPETPAATCDRPPKATTSKSTRNLSAEEAFDEMVGLRTTLDDTPPQKVYTRKQQLNVAASPFSATDVISDLPKTDIQEWVDKLEQESELIEEEEKEFTASTSILDSSKATHDPIAASRYEKSGVSSYKNTTEELLADMSTVSSMVDPLQPSARKSTKSLLTIDVDENETLRPVTPSNTEISGINLLDQTTESVFSEPLVVSDTESVQLEDNENEEVETENSINTSAIDAKKLQDGEEYPIMVVDSSDSEQEEDVKTSEKSDTKIAEIKNPIEMVKPMSEDEAIELDNESTANVTTKPVDIHEEFINFQANKNIAGQHMRASTPNRSTMQFTRERRQSVGAEHVNTVFSIDVSLEKSRLTKEKLRTVIETVVEVDEESVTAATAKDNLTKLEEESVETSANDTEITSIIQGDEEPTATTTESKDNESEFSNFLANKAITSRGKRAATPDRVNKSQSQKITKGRRLTLGAEQHLPNITIDFEEEKIKLEQLKQQPAHIDESPVERDEAMEAVEISENTAEITISTSEPKEIENSAHDTINAEVVEDDVEIQMDREENASKVEENILEGPVKENDKESYEPEKDSIQDLEADISSAEQDNAETLANVAECSAEESQNDVMRAENVVDNIADVCESPTVEDITNVPTTKGDNANKAETVDIVATSSNLCRETTMSRDDTPTVTLTNEEVFKSKDSEESTESSAPEFINEAKSEDAEDKFAEESESTDIEQGSTKEEKKVTQNTDAPATTTFTQDTTKTLEENKHEIANNIDDNTENICIPAVPCEEHNPEETFGSNQVAEIEGEVSTNKENETNVEEEEDNVCLETFKLQQESSTVESELKKKISPAGEEFDESDIFDVTEELPTETPTINTTQGVLFDLTEEDVESTVETDTVENIVHVEQNPHDVIEATDTTEDGKESVATNTKEDNADRTSGIVVEETVLSAEVPTDVTKVSENALNATVEEVEASPANTSSDNEVFTLVISTGSELQNDEETPEVATETTKAVVDATEEVPAVKPDITDKSLEAESKNVKQHSKEEDIVEELTTELSETHKLTEDEKVEIASETTSTAVLTGLEESVVPEDDISSTISPSMVESEVHNKETKENEAIEEVYEAINESEQLPTEDIAVSTSVVTEEVKEEADTAAEIHEIPEQQTAVNQEKCEVSGANEETGAQTPKQTEKVYEDAEIMPLNTDSTEEATHNEKVVIEEFVKSVEEEEQASKLLDENEIDDSVHQTPVEANIEEQQIESPTFSGNQQAAKRRGLKPLKQNKEEPNCKLTVESKQLIEEKVTIETQTLIDTVEKESVKQADIVDLTASTKEGELEQITKAAESREDISQMSVKGESDPSENLGTVETKQEAFVETQVPSKRRGRKPSRSKQATEENDKLVFTAATGEATLVEEQEFSGDKKAINASNFEESSTNSAVATSTRHKTEREFYKKVNYEVSISESAETAHDVKTDKTVELEIPDQNEKSLIDAKYAEQSEIVDVAIDQQLASSTELHEETNATGIKSKTAEAHEPKRARRIRKASQSSQCSVHDEDHLPTTTTRRRGGRRRADTPLEHIGTDVTTSDASTVKRRRQSQDKGIQDTPLEETHVVHVDENKLATVDEAAIEIGNISEEGKIQESGASIEVYSGNINNDVQTADDDQREAATTSKEHVDSGNAVIKGGTNKDRVFERATDEIDEGAQNDSHHSDVDELSNVPVATKRNRRKQTHSELSQISIEVDNTESYTTKRRRRGHNATKDKSTINETMEGAENNHLLKNEKTAESKEDDTTIVPVQSTAAEALETEASNEAKIVVKEDPDTAVETSKRTRNKRTHKVTEISKSNKDLPDESKDIKSEPQDEKAVMEEEEPLKNVTVASHSRVNRHKEADTEDEHHNKTEQSDPKDEETVEKEVQNKIDLVEQVVVETTNTNADSVGGRRGRRGAAAAATVAINEVSSAHKRGALRGKSQQNKSHATRKEAEAKRETDTQLQTVQTIVGIVHDEESSVIEQKKPQKSVRRRRISLKDIQASHAGSEVEGECVEIMETENDAGSSTKVAPKHSRKRRESHHADEQPTLNKSEVYNETSISAPESASAASTKQRSRRKRKDSHQNINDVVVGDEPPKKRPLSRKCRDSSLDSSTHEGTGIDMDTNHGTNTSSSSTTPQRPRRAAAAQDRNYDESSDAEAQVDLKRRIEKASLPKASTIAATTTSSSKQRSPTAAKTPAMEMISAAVTDITVKTTSTPILSTVVTTSRGRQRKPTARVQQYLEEERAKAETPKKRLLIGSAAIGDTLTSQAVGTSARRTRKASTLETEMSETVRTPARSRARTAKVLHVAETAEESRSEVGHTHSELETTHSSSNVEEKAQTTEAKVTKRPKRGRGKQPVAVETATTIENEISVLPATTIALPTVVAHIGSGRVGRAAKAAAAAALITDDPIGSHTKARGGRQRRGADVAVTEEVQSSDTEVKKVQTEATITPATDVRTEVTITPATGVEQTNKKTKKAAASGRTARGGRGRKKQQDHENDTDEHTTQHTLLADGEASSSDALQQQPQHSIIADADDEHEEDEETLTTQAADLEVAKSLAGAKLSSKKRTAATRKVIAVTAATAESPVPKRGRRRAVAAAATVEEGAAASHLDTRAESAASSRSRKVVRFDAATPSSVASATMSVDTATEETEEATSAPAVPAKRATRSRRK